MHTRHIALGLLVALGLSGPALAGDPTVVTFVVDRLDDARDEDPLDGVCAIEAKPDEPKCTLRAAITQANLMFVENEVRIVLQPGATYTLSHAGTDEDFSDTGDLDVNRAMWIGTEPQGGQRARIDGQSLDRIFDVRATQDAVVLADLELVGGETSSFGAAIRSDAPDLQLQRLDIHDMQAPDSATAAVHVVGGITTLTDTHVHASGTSQYVFAGAWAQGNGAAVSLVRSTVSEIAGSGVVASEGATALMQDSTIAHNTIGVNVIDGDVSILRSTLARNTLRQLRVVNSENSINFLTLVASIVDTLVPDEASCELGGAGSLEQMRGYNVYSDVSCEPPPAVLDEGSDVTSPDLGAFGYRGGPTPTFLPASSSVAIDYVPVSMCADTDTDQRGYQRVVAYYAPEEPLCDAGAVEHRGDVAEQRIFSDGFE